MHVGDMFLPQHRRDLAACERQQGQHKGGDKRDADPAERLRAREEIGHQPVEPQADGERQKRARRRPEQPAPCQQGARDHPALLRRFDSRFIARNFFVAWRDRENIWRCLHEDAVALER